MLTTNVIETPEKHLVSFGVRGKDARYTVVYSQLKAPVFTEREKTTVAFSNDV